ncbi:hypothetical protein SPRG_14019 [Saprolegnia parasitica CBS 223.65]|uniref:FHA domain-containing protein n=1 Tax=Saprolegnia parasitica (strain CBS 223.65) TaxID=695850 RepID=A0A067BRP1_SAPPC|nr:hypothetical protein SPRG_14019 [Saprolegnia parasitica CBS 223.65]KDO20928.1 hypothetical protein SPRG_14019 [Saprolegnia parasitica CBS 223.65]|eukprot:XP_012208320.1 hypothetical protein SPRG_14019 [Saprolegnia parasitica CBS 223.65]
MATLRLAATELADASAAAFAAKGLDVIRLRPGGDTWRIERSAMDPLLTDSMEQDALHKMEDNKITSIYYRGNTLQIRTCLVHGVSVNNVALASRTAHALHNGDRIVILASPHGGDIVVYHVEMADVCDAAPQSALYAATALDFSDADSDVEVRHVREVLSDTSSRAAKRQRRAPPSSFTKTRSGSLYQLRLVSDALTPASAAAMKQRRLDVLRLGPDHRAYSFGRSLVAHIFTDPKERQALLDLEDDHCQFLSDHHGNLRVMDTSRFGTRVNTERLEPYAPRLLDVGDKVVLLKSLRGSDLLAYVVEDVAPTMYRRLEAPPPPTTPIQLTPTPAASPVSEHSFLSVASQPPKGRKRCGINGCEKHGVAPQGRCKTHTDPEKRLRCQYVADDGVVCTNYANSRGECEKHVGCLHGSSRENTRTTRRNAPTKRGA